MSEKNHTFLIPDSNKNERLDVVIAKHLPAYSRTQIKSWIDNHAVLLNGQPTQGKIKVKGGETVSVNVIQKPPLRFTAEAIELPIVYEDDAILIINKPVGMVVHPGAGNANHTLLNALLHHAPALQLLPRAGIVHRLDKDTSGLLVVAKTAAALKKISHQLKKRSLIREYQAIVSGSMISGGKIDAPIGRHPRERTHMAVVTTGKHAITHYRIAAKYRSHTLLKIRLETGRTHQIRVHLAHIHHAIVGDKTYGGRLHLSKGMTPDLITLLRQFKRQALHACALGLIHPVTQEPLRFEAPLPVDMQALVNALYEDALKDKK